MKKAQRSAFIEAGKRCTGLRQKPPRSMRRGVAMLGDRRAPLLGTVREQDSKTRTGNSQNCDAASAS